MIEAFDRAIEIADAEGNDDLVVAITAPDPGIAHPYPQITISTATDAGSVVTAAQAVATNDWSVTVGTVGPVADPVSVLR